MCQCALEPADLVASKGLDIVSKGAGPHVCMVEKVMLNGSLISGVTVQDGDLQKDGVLRLEWERDCMYVCRIVCTYEYMYV